MPNLHVGLIGFGTVGAGTAEILVNNRQFIEDRVGGEIVLKRIADLDIRSDRGVQIDPAILTTDAMEVIDDPEIDVVVELIGGCDQALDYIERAMERGKHVISANKALIATRGKQLFDMAERYGVDIAFGASVAGGIPIIKALREGLAANRIQSVLAILNGTSNYILTRMTQEGLSFQEALSTAQRLGYAEANPTLDIDGSDAAHKLTIIISLAFGFPFSFSDIYREGIDMVSSEDITFAGEFGYCVKLLAIARQSGEHIEARVHPAFVPRDHILANVNDAYNAVYVEGDYVGSTLFYGLGAGRKPTGSAVVADLVDMARNHIKGITRRVSPLSFSRPPSTELSIKPMDDVLSDYYFRVSALDRPGVLSKISGILGAHDISIAAVIQKKREAHSAVPVVMLTHEARERDVRKSLELIDKLDVVADKTVAFRVERTTGI
ncbi:MAG: homoserine dehydrogenase [Deltaproteobacteria bacterium]|nr:homoserine dehydrogenase [Deltaproteobacteria bacterium]